MRLRDEPLLLLACRKEPLWALRKPNRFEVHKAPQVRPARALRRESAIASHLSVAANGAIQQPSRSLRNCTSISACWICAG